MKRESRIQYLQAKIFSLHRKYKKSTVRSMMLSEELVGLLLGERR